MYEIIGVRLYVCFVLCASSGPPKVSLGWRCGIVVCAGDVLPGVSPNRHSQNLADRDVVLQIWPAGGVARLGLWS